MASSATAMDILVAIEKGVNEGNFDKALYVSDIKSLKGRPDELKVLKTTLVQLKEHLPQYASDVDYLQRKIEEVEARKASASEKALRFNENFDYLLTMIQERDPKSVSVEEQERKKRKKQKRKQDAHLLAKANEKKSMAAQPQLIKRGLLLRQLLKLVEQQWVTEADFDQLPGQLGLETLPGKIFLMTKVGQLIRLMPEDMFTNEDTRQNMLVAAQDSLDTWIEEEADGDIEGLADVEQSFGIVGEVTESLGLMSSNH